MQTLYFGSWLEVGLAVRRIRTQRGWATGELAAKAQVVPPVVEAIENGTERSDLDSIFGVLEALEVFPAVLPAPENNNWTPDDIDLKCVKAQFA